MATLYHYCSVESLFHILKSRKLRLCDARHMNDHKEVEWAHDAIGRVFTQYDDPSCRDDLTFLWNHLEINKLHPFVFCMSSQPDLLSQWRAYAADGSGVAIGFNADVFAQPTRMPSRHAGTPEVGLWPVVYDPNDQTAQVQRVVVAYLKKCKDGDRDVAMTEALYPLSGYSTFYKNDAFREEAEKRLVYTPMLMTNASNEHRTFGNELEVHQRCTANDIYTYFEYEPVPKGSTTPLVNDIRLGPTCKLSQFDLDYFLALNGYSAVPTSRSSASYRKP
ncbi:hypothetical protein CY658_03055 [Variovorax sp. RO1]|uniref:DUF2971 domain-containing protein n=1 Tax=Variovorax sp. RO1 TaxID=2066034 RepID=UPI000C716769|nr:DUF2971 domain-containing protein [Variovorax sp. RO1]PLC06041.1 hypothetical protein CY658_03055 [Variovorax sp. RO1]